MCEGTQKYIREHFSMDGAWKVIEEDFRDSNEQCENFSDETEKSLLSEDTAEKFFS